MLFKVGDIVSRNSYNNDTLFKIVSIEDGLINLKGVEVRLYADSPPGDLKLEKDLSLKNEDEELIEEVNETIRLDRNEFFYLPGKVLHIDGDDEYLERCINFYKKMKVKTYALSLKEEVMSIDIQKYLKELKPDIVVITGHDFFYKNRKEINNINNYKNSKFFVDAIKKAREYEKSQDKLIIIAGACQSDYESLIKAGANFASSPKRVNIHALDPAIIATSLALSNKNQSIDLIHLIEKTKYGKDGIGGIITNGMMYVGYPR